MPIRTSEGALKFTCYEGYISHPPPANVTESSVRRRAHLLLTLFSAACLALTFGACQEDTAPLGGPDGAIVAKAGQGGSDLPLYGPSPDASLLSNHPDGVGFDDLDGDDLYARAMSFRQNVNQWRDGKLAGKTALSTEAISDELSNTYNALWGNIKRTFARSEVVFDSVRVPTGITTFGPTESLAAYEGVRDIIFGTLAEQYTGEDAAMRFAYVSEPIIKVTGTYLHVYAQIGEGYGDAHGKEQQRGSTTSFQQWGDPNFNPNAPCTQQPRNDYFIQNQQNNMLGDRITVNADGSGSGNSDPKDNTVTYIDGSVVVSLVQGSAPARDADLDLQLRRFVRGNGPNYTTPQNASSGGTFPNAGEYLVHYSPDGNELCFNYAKAHQYVTDHTTLGDGILETEWRAETGNNDPDVERVGAYVFNLVVSSNPESQNLRSHLAKFFYGRTESLDGDTTPLPQIP